MSYSLGPYFCCMKNMLWYLTPSYIFHLPPQGQYVSLFKGRVLFVLLFFIPLLQHNNTLAAKEKDSPFPSPFVQETVDSIRVQISRQSGQDRLDSYTNLIEFLYGRTEPAVEVIHLREYLAEAEKQENIEEICFVRTRIINSFYNNDQEDSLFAYLPECMSFFEEHLQWDYYYNAWEQKVSQYLYSSREQIALREARTMYEMARVKDHSYGKGVAAFLLGNIHRSMDQSAEAELFLQEAFTTLREENNIALLGEINSTLCQVLMDLNRYDEVFPLVESWSQSLIAYKENMHDRGMEVNLDLHFFYCYTNELNAYLGLKDIPNAERKLKDVESLLDYNTDLMMNDYYNSRAELYELKGEYDKAMANLQKTYAYALSANNAMEVLSVREKMARVYQKNGDFLQAADIYEEMLTKKDSIRSQAMDVQLQDMRVRYELDQINSQKTQALSQFRISRILAALLFLFLVVAVYCSWRLYLKNKRLSAYMQEQDRMKETLSQLKEEFKEATGSGTFDTQRNDELFKKLSDYLSTTQSYTRTSLSAQELAKVLQTNTTYLYAAIKANTNQTLVEYIHSLRLEKACQQLIKYPSKTIDRIAVDCGFKSTRNFYRLFRAKFEQSPSEYRESRLTQTN